MTNQEREGDIALAVPAALIEAVAERVVELIEQRAGGATAGATSPYLTVGEAAEYLRVAPQGVYDRVASGALVPCRDGRRLLFKPDDLRAYVEGQR